MRAIRILGGVFLWGMATIPANAASLSMFDLKTELDLTLTSATFSGTGILANDVLSINGGLDDGFDRSTQEGSGQLTRTFRATDPDTLNIRHSFSLGGSAATDPGRAVADFAHDNVFTISNTSATQEITLSFSYRMLAGASLTGDANGQASVFLFAGTNGVGSKDVLDADLGVTDETITLIRSDIFTAVLPAFSELTIFGGATHRAQAQFTVQPGDSPSQNVPAVPLPASALLLGGALLGLLGMRGGISRRKNLC